MQMLVLSILAVCDCSGRVEQDLINCNSSCNGVQSADFVNDVKTQSCITDCNTLESSQWTSCYQKCNLGYSNGFNDGSFNPKDNTSEIDLEKPGAFPTNLAGVIDPKDAARKSNSCVKYRILDYFITVAILSNTI